MEEEEIILVPMKRKQAESLLHPDCSLTGEEQVLVLEADRIIVGCLEGKEELCREDIEKQYTYLMALRSEYISMFLDGKWPKEYERLISQIETLKRWIV